MTDALTIGLRLSPARTDALLALAERLGMLPVAVMVAILDRGLSDDLDVLAGGARDCAISLDPVRAELASLIDPTPEAFWTPQRVEEAEGRWRRGESGAVIARALGPPATRDAVIGKIQRLGLGRARIAVESRADESPITPALLRMADHDPIARQALERKRRLFEVRA